MFPVPSCLVRRMLLKLRGRRALQRGDLFTAPHERDLYRKLATTDSHGGLAAVTLHPRCLGGNAVVCRPGTRDTSSLEDLLVHQFYLPPKTLQAPRVIVDLGANVGYTTAHFAHLYPQARIVGLELDKANHSIAVRNTEWCRDRVKLINAAIWSSDGYVTFSGPGEDAYHVDASVGAEGRALSTAGTHTARSVTMQTLLDENGITHVDYLKMDIEGGEAEVLLKADRSWLKRVATMKIELHRVSYAPFADVLTSHGFRCWKEDLRVPCIVAIRA